MQTFVALMRRYCIDYTNAHDISQIASLMSPDYRITISGRTMDLTQYRQAVSAAFAKYPTLALTVHDIMVSDDSLAMRFSEHGALDGDDTVAVWGGISIYRWDGRRLLTCRVEQDFQGRDQQCVTGLTAPLEQSHPDPWVTTRDETPSAENESVAHDWLLDYTARPQEAGGVVRLLETAPSGPLLDQMVVEVHDLFSAGPKVAMSVTFRGKYAGGLEFDRDVAGMAAHLPTNLIATVDEGTVTTVDMVRDRWGLVRRLRQATHPDR